MKIHFYIASMLAVICAACMSVQAQQVLGLREVTAANKTHSLPDSGAGIVDMNSTIRIDLNQAEIQDQIFRFEGLSEGDSRLSELKKLNEILRAETEILELINSITGQDSNQFEAYKRLATLKMEVYRLIKQHPDLYTELAGQSRAANEFVRSGQGPFIVFVLNFLEARAQRIRDALYLELEGASATRVYFRLAGFIKNKSGGRPIHIENFDDYSAESFQELELFSAPLTAEDRQTIASHKQLTEELRGGLSTGIQQAKTMLIGGLDSLYTSEEAITSFRQTVLDVRDQMRAAKKDTVLQFVTTRLTNLDDLNLLYGSMQSLVSTFSGNFSGDSLSGDRIEARLIQLEQQIDGVLGVIPTELDRFESANARMITEDQEVGGSISRIRGDYQQVRSSVDQDISKVKKFLADVKNLLNPFRKAYLASEEIGEEVRRFTADNIPDVGYIDLRYIGERKAGDEILIKAVLEKGKRREAKDYEERMLYRRFISIARVAAHVKMSGSLILANPYNRENNSRVNPNLNQYQFAPTYGIFMKWGSRKSHFYNEFINLGIGMAFSSPDFNLDGTPELGASIMLTGFRDIIGGGWGWNFGADTPYLFIGFNIPFNVGGLSGSPGGNSDSPF